MITPRLAALAVLLTIAAGGTALAQPMPPNSPAPLPTNNPAAAANVRESEQYSALLRSNPAFRKKREAIECGPITDPQLHQQCIASFEAYASAPPPKRGGR
jgi:hypothetical protein